MSVAMALALLAAPATAAAPPPGLVFGFHRMAAFRQRAKELGCGAIELDNQFEAVRKKLVRRYGKKAFALPKIPSGAPGDCYVATSVSRANLADFRKEAEAVLAASPAE